jgi:hypothetical protein
MKRCPRCYQPYSDSERFCELDGQQLLADISVSLPVGKTVETAAAVTDRSAQKREASVMVIIGVMVGVFLTSMGYVGYALLTASPAPEESSVPVSRVATMDTRQPTHQTRPAVIEPSPAPEEESSPTPEAEAEAEETPAAPTDTIAAARLNQGPVSTGERAGKGADRAEGKTIIEMNDGTTLEVDAAWQDKQGIWYRRGGLVSFLDSKRIKGIHALQEPRQEAKPDSSKSSNP